MAVSDLRKNDMMAHLLDSLEAGKDIGQYGRLVFAMVARHFVSENELVKLLSKDKNFSEDDAKKLGDAIPSANRKDERLRLVRSGDDGETRIVLLYQDNYLYDDLAGEGHSQTTISCERALTRDVQDFITHARTQKYR